MTTAGGDARRLRTQDEEAPAPCTAPGTPPGRGTEQLGYACGLIHQPLDPPCTSIVRGTTLQPARLRGCSGAAGAAGRLGRAGRPVRRRCAYDSSRDECGPSSSTPTCCGTCPTRRRPSSTSAGVPPTSRCRWHASATTSPSLTPHRPCWPRPSSGWTPNPRTCAAASGWSRPPASRPRRRPVGSGSPQCSATAVCHGVLMYLARPEPLLAAVCRCAAPGGVVPLMTLNARTLAVRPALERRALHQELPPPPPAPPPTLTPPPAPVEPPAAVLAVQQWVRNIGA